MPLGIGSWVGPSLKSCPHLTHPSSWPSLTEGFFRLEGEQCPICSGHPRREWLAGYLQDIHNVSRSKAEPAASVPGTVTRWEKQSLLPACVGTDGCVEVPGVWVLYALGTECDLPWRDHAGRQVAAVVTTPLLPGMLEFQRLTPAVPGRPSPAQCLPQTLLLAPCASCLVNNSCQERQRQWNLFKTRRI